LLVAATGVGAGDLLTAGYAGSRVGLSLIWAVIFGAVLKWSLTEGLARWQMATGTTLLEGWATRLGGWIRWVFLGYLLLWSLVTGASLGKACGVAGDGLLPIGDRGTSQLIWTVIHALGGLTLVWFGGFRTFERLMAALVGSMFACVLCSAVLLRPDWQAVADGLVRPSIKRGDLPYAIGLLGGVGGTVTLLSYGYWIRESGRSGASGARLCRLDLGVAYLGTALFGVAMLIISSRVEISREGAEVALALADQIGEAGGPLLRVIFLVGFWGAVFSSLLGVWQSAPYLFADFRQLSRADRGEPPAGLAGVDLARTPAYRSYLVAIAVVPLVLVGMPVRSIQLAHAVLGALFMPLLALTLLIMNNHRGWVGDRFRSGWLPNLLLGMTLVAFLVVGGLDLSRRFFGAG
jgi:Mn2+/Fe2+ NRAMP family transporter